MCPKIVTIHQPEHLPWLGFFHKMSHADEFIILDNVQFRKNYFQNRNKIRTRTGWQWLTVPIEKHQSTDQIRQIKIKSSEGWEISNLNRIQANYVRAPYFTSFFEDLKKYFSPNSDSLVDLNVQLIKFLQNEMNIPTSIILASTILDNPGSGGTNVTLNLCKAVGADIYLSGVGGREYLDTNHYMQEGIDVIFQDFHHPEYSQCYEPFIPAMSAIDLLMNHGEKSGDILKGANLK